MPKRAIDYCFDLMEHLKVQGKDEGHQITTEELGTAINMVIGADSRTAPKYWKLLQDFSLIKSANDKNTAWILNFNRLYEMSI